MCEITTHRKNEYLILLTCLNFKHSNTAEKSKHATLGRRCWNGWIMVEIVTYLAMKMGVKLPSDDILILIALLSMSSSVLKEIACFSFSSQSLSIA